MMADKTYSDIDAEFIVLNKVDVGSSPMKFNIGANPLAIIEYLANPESV